MSLCNKTRALFFGEGEKDVFTVLHEDLNTRNLSETFHGLAFNLPERQISLKKPHRKTRFFRRGATKDILPFWYSDLNYRNLSEIFALRQM